jgi:rubrerythrin
MRMPDLPADAPAMRDRLLVANDDEGLRTLERQARNRAIADDGSAPVRMARKVDLCCSLCGYGIVSRTPPARCPMCGADGDWSAPPGWTSRRAALQERRTG